MRVRLHERDAQRLGCDQILSVDTTLVTVAEVEELADRFTFDPYDWPHPLFGEIAFEDAGNADAKPKAPRWQARAVVWLALHQNGHKATWDDAGSVSAVGLGFLADEDEGKDPAPSAESEGSTTQPSGSSTD